MDSATRKRLNRRALGLDLTLAADLGTQRGRNADDGRHACTGPWQNST